jgi:DNA (cytosine-5)-methyltransferase 1
VREAARLQGFPDWFNFGDQSNAASYKQLGNGVCVGVVWHVMKQAVEQFEDILKKTCPQLVQDVLNSPTNPNCPLKKLKSSHKANSVQLKR